MKPEQKEMLRERAREALRDLYHNATVTYPRDLYGRSEDYAQSWLENAAQFEIEYIRDGGAHGSNPRATFEHPANAGRYKSEAARRRYVAKSMRDLVAERRDCGMLTGWRVLELAAGNERLRKITCNGLTLPEMRRNDALWERITEYGKLYQWGRGGRTLAPDDLIRTGGGGSFCIREDYADEMQPAALVDFIRILESFNRYVMAWCAYVPDGWREHCEAEDAEDRAQKARAAARKAKETRERNYWACRGVVTA